MSHADDSLVDTITNDDSNYRQTAALAVDTPDDIPEIARRLLTTDDRDLVPDETAYVELDNPTGELFSHVTVDVPGYHYVFELKPSPWPTSPWLDEVHRKFISNIPETIAEPVELLNQLFGRPHGWTGHMFTDKTAPLFQYAAQNVNNWYVPDVGVDRDWIQNPFESTPDESAIETIAQKHTQTEDILRVVYGDTVPVFRGISPSEQNPSAATPTRVSDQFQKIHGTNTTFTHRHRTIESWSLDPGYATRYARGRSPNAESGILLRREVPTENILATSSTTRPLNQYESETIVMHPSFTEYTTDHVYLPNDLTNQDLTELALTAITHTKADLV